LNAESLLAARVPSTIGSGGVEIAFAATRSILISQALHAAVLEALGQPMEEAHAILRRPPAVLVEPALAALASCGILIVSGRSELQGVAENAALCLMELARMPTYSFEGGQLRHGPMELLDARTGLILLRPAGPAADLAGPLAAACQAEGCPVVVFDTSGAARLSDGLTLAFLRLSGFAATFAVLPPLQLLLVGIAAQKVPDLGVPLRSSKVTTAL
jgi:fructoselysine-6-P-deglycase FrlB-like protein